MSSNTKSLIERVYHVTRTNPGVEAQPPLSPKQASATHPNMDRRARQEPPNDINPAA
jgi:hypothetical protein